MKDPENRRKVRCDLEARFIATVKRQPMPHVEQMLGEAALPTCFLDRRSYSPEKFGSIDRQERLLTLLSEAKGASIEEMMQATDWQDGV